MGQGSSLIILCKAVFCLPSIMSNSVLFWTEKAPYTIKDLLSNRYLEKIVLLSSHANNIAFHENENHVNWNSP